MTTKIDIKCINKSDYPTPCYATTGSAGADIFANISEDCIIYPNQRALIPTGLFIALPMGYEAQIRSRSGLTLRHGIIVANGVGTIDSDYRGEIRVILLNTSDTAYTVHPGDKIAQMVIARYEQAEFTLCDSLPPTERNEKGFGHSGK